MGKSSRLAIVLAGARLFCLGVLALLSLPFDFSVGAVTFAFSGFEESSLSLVPNSNWIFNTSIGCFQINPAENDLNSIGSGRFLYPGAVQMKDPGSTTVKSFSTSFIYKLQIGSNLTQIGPGLAFIIVPDNITLGAPGDFMGLMTSETSQTAKNYVSDNHTLGVELDTYMNPGFNDTNNNHVGINLASMNSTYSFEPVYSLPSSSAIAYQQIWIDYDETDSRMEIYYANYKEGKPANLQGSQSGLDLSLLKENMFTGFSSANKLGSFDVPYVCAWSFSNDGIPAPSIVIAQDATPGAPPPPAPDGPVAAPSRPPPASTPSPPPVPPTIAKKGGKKKNLTGVYVGASVIVGLCIFVLYFYLSHPLRTFVCHAGGKDGSEKNFPTSLVQSLRSYFKWSNITFFFDRDNIGYGEIIHRKIFAELARSDVGIVVVTDDFFRGRWPMRELIGLIDKLESDESTGKLLVLPLFYKLTPEDIRDHVRDRTWEPDWEKLSTGNHPLELEKCRNAATWLCTPRGVEYCFNKRDHDKEYIEEICRHLDKILRKERSFASYLRLAITSFSCSK